MEPDVVKSWNDDWDRRHAKTELARSRHEARMEQIRQLLRNCENFAESYGSLTSFVCVDVVDIQEPINRDEMKDLFEIVFEKYLAERRCAHV